MEINRIALGIGMITAALTITVFLRPSILTIVSCISGVIVVISGLKQKEKKSEQP